VRPAVSAIEIDRRLLLAGGMTALLPLPAIARGGDDFVVSKSGRSGRSGRPGSFRTVGAALAAAKAAGKPCRIRIEPGIYEEKLLLDTPGVHLAGEPGAVLSFGAAAGMSDPQGRNWGTGRTATLIVTAPDVILSGLTIRNSFDYLQNHITHAVDGAQAVALMLGRGADRSQVRGCRLEGYQDTLYVQEGRAWFRDCDVSGNVDFIFGGAATLFERCEIRSRYVPGNDLQGYLAAPSTPMTQPIGLVFRDCRLTREAGLPDNSVYLGRPWRAGGNMDLTGAAAFLDCWMDAHIRRDGWTWMGYTNPAGERTQLTPQEARLFEAGSKGPGAGPAADTRRILTPEQARRYDRANIFGDWRPQ